MTPQDMAATHAAAFTQSRPWSADEFADLLRSPRCFAVGHAQCFALGRVVADQAELLTLATHPDHQRAGLARSTLAQWRAVAYERGAVSAFLEVAVDNTPARAFYSADGFVENGLRKAYYSRRDGSAADAALMIRPLP
jgi:[ribosomal protein S18]-alanine N-acetyltransferase